MWNQRRLERQTGRVERQTHSFGLSGPAHRMADSPFIESGRLGAWPAVSFQRWKLDSGCFVLTFNWEPAANWDTGPPQPGCSSFTAVCVSVCLTKGVCGDTPFSSDPSALIRAPVGASVPASGGILAPFLCLTSVNGGMRSGRVTVQTAQTRTGEFGFSFLTLELFSSARPS